MQHCVTGRYIFSHDHWQRRQLGKTKISFDTQNSGWTENLMREDTKRDTVKKVRFIHEAILTD